MKARRPRQFHDFHHAVSPKVAVGFQAEAITIGSAAARRRPMTLLMSSDAQVACRPGRGFWSCAGRFWGHRFSSGPAKPALSVERGEAARPVLALALSGAPSVDEGAVLYHEAAQSCYLQTPARY